MENVTLAQFDFDTSKVSESINRVQKELFELQKAQKANRDESTSLQKELNALKKANEDLAKSEGDNTAQINSNNKAIEELTKRQLANYKSKQDLSAQSKNLNSEYRELTKVQNLFSDAQGQAVSITDAVNSAMNVNIRSVVQAQNQNSELIKIKKQLNTEDESQKKLIDEISKKIDENTEYIKDNSSEWEKQKINIGGYKNDIKEALNEVNLFNGGLGGFISRSQEAGGVGNLLKNSLSGVATGFVGLTKAALAFVLTPVGAVVTALVAGFLLLKNAMSSNSETATKVNTIFAKLSGVFSGLLKVLEPLGSFIADVLVAGFEAWANVAGAVFDKVTNLTAAVLDFFGATEASEAVKKFNQELKDSADLAVKIVDAENRAAKAQREAKKTMLEYQKEAEKLRQTRDDDTLSINDRIAANDKLGETLQKQLKVEQNLAKETLRLAQLRVQAAGGVQKANNELLDALSAAETELEDIEERIVGQQSEQLTNRNSLEKEANDKAIELKKQRQDAEIKFINEEIALFKAQQGFKAKTLQEQYDLELKEFEKRKALLDKELAYGKKTRTEYNTAILELQNNLAQKSAEITVENAKLELDKYIRLNNSKYLENKRLNDSLLSQETERLTNELNLRKKFADLQLQQGIIDKTAYNDQILALDTEYLQKQKDIEKQFKEVKKEDELTEKALEREARILEIQENLGSDYEIAKEKQIEIDELERADLLNKLETNKITRANYDKAIENQTRAHALAMKQIDNAVLSEKLNLYKGVFSDISGLLGEQTAAGKAAGIATATINTYQGVSEVWKSPAILPEPANTIMKAVQSAVTVASGLQAVKKITSVKTPNVGATQGLATGGEVDVNGFAISRANGDDRLITAQTGEVMLSRESRSMLGDNLLSLAGVPNLGNSEATSNGSLGNSNLITSLAMAVQQGAAQGSAQGSAQGTQSGMIGLSDNRSIQQMSSF